MLDRSVSMVSVRVVRVHTHTHTHTHTHITMYSNSHVRTLEEGSRRAALGPPKRLTKSPAVS